MSEEEEEKLRGSIAKFGIVDPLVVNDAEERKGILIGGHQRYKIYKKMGLVQIPVVKRYLPDIRDEQELCLRLTNNIGSIDYELLISIDDNILMAAGFETEDIMENLRLSRIEDIELEGTRTEVVTVEAPGAVRLKERKSFYCETMEEYLLIINFFKTDSESVLDKIKLMESMQ